MDCITAKENINLYVDNMLDDKEVERLFLHIGSCDNCKKELDDIIALKKALSGLSELAPPEGLALLAIKKAKKRRAPVFAYASIGVAAAIALAVVLSSSFVNNNDDISRQLAAAPAVLGAASSAAPESVGESLAMGSGNAKDAPVPANDSLPYIYTVPAELSESFKAALSEFINENGITAQYSKDNNDTVSFVIPKENLAKLKKLIQEANIPHEGDPAAGTLVEFVFD